MKELNSFSPTTSREPLRENDCAKSTYDCAKSTYKYAAPTCNVQYSNPPFAPTAKLNKEADIDRSFERSIVSSNVVERSLGQYH